jgi:hypothetical protein
LNLFLMQELAKACIAGASLICTWLSVQVWSMQHGQCMQTLPHAHGPSSQPTYAGLVMGLLPYQASQHVALEVDADFCTSLKVWHETDMWLASALTMIGSHQS